MNSNSDLQARKAYAKLYPMYRSIGDCNGPVASVMRGLRAIA